MPSMTSPPTITKKFTRPKRNVSVTVHLSKEEKLRLDKFAFDADVGTGTFVRKLILNNFKLICDEE